MNKHDSSPLVLDFSRKELGLNKAMVCSEVTFMVWAGRVQSFLSGMIVISNRQQGWRLGPFTGSGLVPKMVTAGHSVDLRHKGVVCSMKLRIEVPRERTRPLPRVYLPHFWASAITQTLAESFPCMRMDYSCNYALASRRVFHVPKHTHSRPGKADVGLL